MPKWKNRAVQSDAERKRRKNARMKLYGEKNREAIVARRAARYKVNREKVLKKRAEYVKRNADQVKKACRAQYYKNREVRLKQAAEYRAAHPGLNKAYRQANLKRFAEYRERRRDEMRAYQKAYRKAHPEKARASWQLRRARKMGATIGDKKLITKWEKAWRSKPFVNCYWCRGRFPAKKCHADHIIALDKKGQHTVENLCISCQPCNNKKNTKSLETWNANLSEPVLL